MKFIADKSMMDKEMPTLFNYPELQRKTDSIRGMEQGLFNDGMETGLECMARESSRACN